MTRKIFIDEELTVTATRIFVRTDGVETWNCGGVTFCITADERGYLSGMVWEAISRGKIEID